jgi:hypothetical protein
MLLIKLWSLLQILLLVRYTLNITRRIFYIQIAININGQIQEHAQKLNDLEFSRDYFKLLSIFFKCCLVIFIGINREIFNGTAYREADESRTLRSTNTHADDYFISLDEVSYFTFQEDFTDKRRALINFYRPHGNNDRVHIACHAIDVYYLNDSRYLENSTENCYDCNSISISPIMRGVAYICVATAMKQNGTNVILNEFDFNTSM